MKNLLNLSFLLIELANELKFYETQGQDWGVILTKNKKMILIRKFKVGEVPKR
jgi:hypothetical protein